MSKENHHHGWCGTKTYTCWDHMLDRCSNPKSATYKDYGGRGINVCPRWQYFENFLADMGPMPEKLTLERVNNDRGYDPENCIWADMVQQIRNQRSVRKSASGYKGVRRHGSNWQAFIYVDKKFKGLGTFDTIELALAARKAAEKKYWGLNPDLDRRIPKKIKAGGMTFEIRYPYEFIERTDIAGRIMFDEEVILISDTAESGKRATKGHAFRVFWHELSHCLDKIYCAEGLGTEMDKETLVDGIGFGIAQILTDNFYVIPKEVE